MTDELSAPVSDNADLTPALEGDTSKRDHMIPKSRLDDEIRKRRELEESLSHMSEQVLATVPDQFRDLIPEGSPAQQAAWVNRAHNSGLFAKPNVPGTDSGKPKNTPVAVDYNSLPVHARMARGYGN